MRNHDIHTAFSESGVRKWVVAEKLGMSDVTFSKKLRKELSENEKSKVLSLIEEFKKQKEGE